MSTIGESGRDSPERWLRIRAIFDEAQALPFEQQASLLEQLCDGDAELLEDLETLLEASNAEEELAKNFSGAGGTASLPKRVGPYQIDRLLGRGGMGAVYLAHRADGEFDQQVAIKLIDVPITSGFFRKQFRTERQILAGLSHPFVARLIDGGVSAQGELYLAMEYIDGIPILQYCQENKLSLRNRLLLFKHVCTAVQYAHQNLIVHRDLKPDNILIVADGTPRLLDFGTAKLLAPLPADSPGELTMRGLRSFTPQYASPEQVLGRPISTASDIYSLGVILFQLLADRPPYFLREFNMEEMLHLVCEEQPPRPSKVAIGAEKPDSDLDSIALMALRKEPAERYLSVEQLAGDIQMWLDGRPVIARRGTLRYRLGKFAKRNKAWFGAVVLLAASLVCGIAGVLWQSRLANLQRIRAEANAQEMRDLSSSFLSEIDAAVKELPGSTPVRRLMVQRVLEHLDRIASGTSSDQLTRIYLVNAYIQLGRVQGSGAEQSIGDGPGALASLNKAVAIAESISAEYPKDQTVEQTLVKALKTRSLILYGLARPSQAVASIMPAIEILERDSQKPTATKVQLADAAAAYELLGAELGDPETPSIGDYSAALDAYRKIYDLSVRALTMDPTFSRSKRSIAEYHLLVAHIFIFTNPEEAIEELHKCSVIIDSLQNTEKSSAETRLFVQWESNLLGKALSRTRQYGPAVLTLEKTRNLMERDAISNPADSRAQTFLAGILGDEAEAYIDISDPMLNPSGTDKRQQARKHAERLLREAISIHRKLLEIDASNQMWVACLAYEKVLLGTLEEGQDHGADDLASGITELRRLASADDASSEILYRATVAQLVAFTTRLRDTKLAVQYAERFADLSHRTDPTSLEMLAQAYIDDGQIEKANTVAKEGLSLLAPRSPGTLINRCRILLGHLVSETDRTR